MSEQEKDARRAIARILNVPVEQITDDADIDTLGGDSLDAIEAVMVLENIYDVEIDDDDLTSARIGTLFAAANRAVVLRDGGGVPPKAPQEESR